MARKTSESSVARSLLIILGVAAIASALSMLPIASAALGWTGPSAIMRSLGVPYEWRFGVSSGATLFARLMPFALAVLLIVDGRALERVAAAVVVLWVPASEWALGSLRNAAGMRLPLIGAVLAWGCVVVLIAAVLALRLGLRGGRAEQAHRPGAAVLAHNAGE